MQWQEGHVAAPLCVSHTSCRVPALVVTPHRDRRVKNLCGRRLPEPIIYIYGVRTQVKRRGRGCRLQNIVHKSQQKVHTLGDRRRCTGHSKIAKSPERDQSILPWAQAPHAQVTMTEEGLSGCRGSCTSLLTDRPPCAPCRLHCSERCAHHASARSARKRVHTL